ncbi:MAG: hypothetical protein ACYS1C_02200, partial [Planctomycetota bacterium]
GFFAGRRLCQVLVSKEQAFPSIQQAFGLLGESPLLQALERLTDTLKFLEELFRKGGICREPGPLVAMQG